MRTASLICVLLLAGVPAIRAQQTPAPVAAARPGTLVASCDVDCTWKLDGKEQGSLKKKEKANVPVALGEHLIEAASADGVYLWAKKVVFEKAEKKNVKIEMVQDSPWVDKNGLMWAPKDNGRDVNFEQARKYCSRYTNGPYTGWRLPHGYEVGVLMERFHHATVKDDPRAPLGDWVSVRARFLWLYEGSNLDTEGHVADGGDLTAHTNALCVRDVPVIAKPVPPVGPLAAAQATNNASAPARAGAPSSPVVAAGEDARVGTTKNISTETHPDVETYRNFRYPAASKESVTGAESDIAVFRAQVRQVLVTVDVYKIDNLWQSVERVGLRSSDFRVTVDGREVDVQYFHEVADPKIILLPGATLFAPTGRGAWALAQSRLLSSYGYYAFGFTPPESPEGVCHQIKVKLNGVPGNLSVLPSPTRYCYSSGEDPLAGTALGEDLEGKARDTEKGSLNLKVAAWPFYVAPNVAQLQINLSFPKDAIHQWLEKSMYYNVRTHVLGVIYGKDGKLAARFSDNYDQMTQSNHGVYDEFAPMQYVTELNLPPGEYTLKIALSDDKNFGTAQTPFRVDSYDGHSLGLSAIALTAHVRSLRDARFDVPQLPVIKPSPLVSQGVQYLPETAQAFDLHEPLYLYFELYEPGLQSPEEPSFEVQLASIPAPAGDASTPVSSAAPPKVEYRLRLVDAKSGAVAMDSGRLDAAKFLQQDSIVIPIGEKLNLGKLAKGCYRLEVQGFDSLGQQTPVRAEAFCVQ
jgi:hypothetical protein